MKPKYPWFKFNPQRWLGDAGLRACSIAARGLWIDLKSLAHQATPYGHVLVNGNAPDAALLARMTGLGVAECESLIAELEANGVFSRTRQGVIYSREMVDDAKKAVHARNIGLKGGNPTLRKERQNQRQDNPSLNGQDKPKSLESRYQSSSEEHGIAESDSAMTKIPSTPSHHADSDFSDSPNGKHYAFRGGVIRLNRRDLDDWRKRYYGIPDIEAELDQLDAYYATLDNGARKSWWHRAKAALNKKHQSAVAQHVAEEHRRREEEDVLH